MLQQRREHNRFRKLTALVPLGGAHIGIDGKTLINFCSNDYLGLASHPLVKERSNEFTEAYGAGATASRLVSGSFTIHEQLEHKLASAFERESVLLLNSGFQGNLGILSSVADRNSLILIDRLCHNSLILGSRLSQATVQRFRHNDDDHLGELLASTRHKNFNRIWIVTETVFSMDGDRNHLDRILSLAEDYDAYVYSDDAHAIGLLGNDGLGLNHGHDAIDLALGTFGKSFGAFGAFVGCSSELKEFFINTCPAVIYSTALPPSVIGAIDAALDLIPSLNEERQRILGFTQEFKVAMTELGYQMAPSDSQIIPVLIGSDEDVLRLSAFLEDQGIWASAIRPPTVPEGTSRIRLTFTAHHTASHIDQLLTAFKTWKNR